MSPVGYPIGARRITCNRPHDGTSHAGLTTTVSLRDGVGMCETFLHEPEERS